MKKILYNVTWIIAVTTAHLFGQTTITSFTPSSGPIGTAVTIIGTNFSSTAANNIVLFGATRANVTAASTTQLTVTVPAGATYQPISVTVAGLTGYSPQPFIVTFLTGASFSSASFAANVDVVTRASAYRVATGDIDGDGKPDLVVVSFGSSTVSVFRDTSSSGSITSASFAISVDLTTGSTPVNVAIGDIDGDGKLDLAVANNGSSNVSVFRNTSSSGAISFDTRVDLTTGAHPNGVAIGDIDGDGMPDLVVTSGGSGVSVFRNQSSSGSISFIAAVDFTTGSTPVSVAIGDIDGDGKPDVVVVNQSSNTVSVLRNTTSSPSITFDAKVDSTTGNTPVGVAIGDIDGDGKPDLAVVSNGGALGTISVLRNLSSSGIISLTRRVDFTTGKYPQGVAIGDVDGDGKPDLVVANGMETFVSVFRNTSSSGSITSGSLDAPVGLTTGTDPYAVALVDIDGDGKPDLATANYISGTVSILLNIAQPPLAVELISFVATANHLCSDLVWKTATETNNYGFEIQRRQLSSEPASANTSSSTRNTDWTKVGFVRGAGTSASPHTYTFNDPSLSYGWYSYRLKQIDASGNSSYSSTTDVQVGRAPKVFMLEHNYPNPFNPMTNIEFAVPQDGRARVTVYNTLGQEVATLLDQNIEAGVYHRVIFDATHQASGTYLVQLEFGGRQLVRKIMLIR